MCELDGGLDLRSRELSVLVSLWSTYEVILLRSLVLVSMHLLVEYTYTTKSTPGRDLPVGWASEWSDFAHHTDAGSCVFGVRSVGMGREQD